MVDIRTPQAMLGGLSAARFMQRHWQRQPLLVRQALAGVAPPLARAELFALAARDDVESRLVTREGSRWKLRRGPLLRRALPALATPGWTLLVQGLDLHVDAAHDLLSRFRFVPEARLDDVMLSYASDAGGVGPHIDSYDVFLLQVAGRRRWRVGRCPRPRLREDIPLKMLAVMTVEHDWVLEPGDMLYLPPGWAHEGVAVGGDCMTASIGFRSPTVQELAGVLLERIDANAVASVARYRDAGQAATARPGAVPPPLQRFARRALARATGPDAIDQALGEWLTEPKPQVWFDRAAHVRWPDSGWLRLDRRTRVAYDEQHLYINGESVSARGRDARIVRTMVNQRRLALREANSLSHAARELVLQWLAAGWLHAGGEDDEL